MVRFDDHADGLDGTRLYANRTVLVMRTKWGKVVDHEDFYVDTGAIVEFDRTLTELGVTPIPKQRECAASRPRDRRGRPLAGIDETARIVARARSRSRASTSTSTCDSVARSPSTAYRRSWPVTANLTRFLNDRIYGRWPMISGSIRSAPSIPTIGASRPSLSRSTSSSARQAPSRSASATVATASETS